MTHTLSAAQHRERQDAARARWAAAKAGAGVAGAALGASIAQAHIQHRHTAALTEQLRAADEVLAPEEARHAAKDAQIVLNGLRVKAAIGRRWPVPAMRAALFQDKRGAVRARHAAEHTLAPVLEHQSLVQDSLAGEPAADADESRSIREHLRLVRRTAEPIASLAAPARDQADAQARIDSLADARKPYSKERAGRSYSITPHTRRIQTGREVRPKYAAQLDEWHAAIGEAEDAGHDIPGNAAPPRHWFRNTYRDVEVKPRSDIHETDAHRVRVEGVPDRAGVVALRRELAGRLQAHVAAHRDLEAAIHDTRLAAAHEALRPRIAAALRWIPGRRLQAGLLAGGALGGALLGYGAAAGGERLGKAAGDEQPSITNASDHQDTLPDAAAGAEPSLAQMLARMFGSWKDDAAADLLTPRKSSLYSTMLTDLDHATRPLDPVLRAGMAAPLPLTVEDADGNPRHIVVSLAARGPDQEAYVQNYRQDRIVQLAQAQRETIRDILLNAAREGASPQGMASQIRQTIGLTTSQANQVLNYRSELEHGDPASQQRALRDKRYDGVVDRSLKAGAPLAPDQIDRMVDAYHRRFLAYRAMVIARTEGVGAANNAHVASVRAFLAQNPDYTVVKTWNANLDSRTRHDHVKLHGQSVVGIDTPFTCESGETIRWPHDPKASAKEVIQCRCFPALRIVARSLAGRLGMSAVQPFSEYLTPPGPTP